MDKTFILNLNMEPNYPTQSNGQESIKITMVNQLSANPTYLHGKKELTDQLLLRNLCGKI